MSTTTNDSPRHPKLQTDKTAPGVGMTIVRMCFFCSKKTTQAGGGMIPVRRNNPLKQYACKSCKTDREHPSEASPATA